MLTPNERSEWDNFDLTVIKKSTYVRWITDCSGINDGFNAVVILMGIYMNWLDEHI